MNQPNELKDFWRRTVTIYVDDENSPIPPTINEVEGEEKDYNSDNEVNNKDEE